MATAKKSGVPTWVWILIGAFVLLPVLAVIGLVVAGMGVGFLTYSRLADARADTARADAQTIQSSAQMYISEHVGGECPGIADMVSDGTLSSQYDHDPWGHEWGVSCGADGAVRVESGGPDGQLHNGDDIVVE